MCTDGWSCTSLSLSQSYNKLIFLLQPLRLFWSFVLFCISSSYLHHLQRCKSFLLELRHWDFILFTFKSDCCFCTVTWLQIFLLINLCLVFFLIEPQKINTSC